MRFNSLLSVLGVCVLLTISSCTLFVNDNATPNGSPEVQALQKNIMTTFDVMRGTSATGSKALTPFRSVDAHASRATVPIFATTSMAFSGTGTKAEYPEPGQSSTWVISSYTTGVYRIDVTTTFPSTDPRDYQIESYLIKDADANNLWTNADPVVQPDGTANSSYRLKNRLNYRDGSYQDEIITTVKFTPDGYQAFDINGTLDYPNLFVPVIDSGARYSSVVAYVRNYTNAPSYSFWSGSSVKTIVGIRYYTERLINSNTNLQADMVVFEKAVTDLSTIDGTFVQAASSLFLPGLASSPNPTFLSQSFLRQRIVYGMNADGTVTYTNAARDTRMKTLVVNITGQKDFYITKINNQANELTTTSIDPATSTLFIPSGDATEVLANTPAAAADIKLNNSTYKTGDAAPVQITTNTPTGDLGTLWVSLDNGVASNAPSTTDVAGDLTGTTDVKGFNGKQGIMLTVPEPATLYSFNEKGTVQAWIYINAQSDTAGIVHAGARSDFLDEIWSLQFMGANGQLAFSLSTNDGKWTASKYTYDWVGSTTNLTIKKWYHVVATWDRTLGTKNSYMQLYINGVANKKGTFTNCVKATALFGVASAPIVIGSQFYDATQVLSGYYGFNGKVNGVKIDNKVLTAAEVLAQYNAYKGSTAGW